MDGPKEMKNGTDNLLWAVGLNLSLSSLCIKKTIRLCLFLKYL